MINIPENKLKDFLIKDGLVAPKAFDDLAVEAKRMGQGLGDLLISKGIISADYYYNLLARYFGVERIDLGIGSIEENFLKKLSEELARQKRTIIFNVEANGALDAAMEDPSDLETIEFLKRHLKVEIKPFLATSKDLERGYALYGRQLTEDFKKIIEDSIRASLRSRAGSVEGAAKELPIVEIVDNILSYAVSLRASDIHIEILEETILIRYRIDGILKEIIRIPKEVHPAVVARLKLLAGLKIDEHLKPQDGRFRHNAAGNLIDVRVSIIPVSHGEKVEMRLLPSSQKPLSLEELGMLEDTLKIVKENLKKTYGMVLVCGPTGSGKSTTLYSVLNILNRPEVNIVTIEDPIEYDMKYINQTQINPASGLTFANGLRAFLRQDPNIILVGEIRDEETAEISAHAALTGHLLLSTLHTNDASTAVPRLIDMKIVPFLVAAILNVIIAQRLVRKVCLDCIESYPPERGLIDFLKQQLKELNSYTKIFSKTEESGELRTPKFFYRGRGCSACNFSGYRGRIAIFEALNVTEEIRKLIVSAEFSLDALITTAKKEGMITMFEDGLRKAELGMTTIEEVLRVIRE
ncbi:Flp pilus assembly complex ATPase component TadA [Candidatus Wolfebacteria bacterium]|nr:Flp pilus assembly complex ATPase component TadA [Candidatus Wolfebacteria bacterium]